LTEQSSHKTTSILVLNGPNLNFLGRREPHLYGSTTLAEVQQSLADEAHRHGIDVDFRQTNSEAVLIDAVQEAMVAFDGVIINAGGLSHTSIALRDALAMIPVPIVEVHVTNIHAREEFRHHSFVSEVASAVIVGAGTYGYSLALEHIMTLVPLDAQPAAGQSPTAPSGLGSVLVLNGPNLNFLGQRQPEIYGRVTLEEIHENAAAEGERLGLACDFRQYNSESALIDAAQEAMTRFSAVVINPAGFTFSSVGLRDALAMLPVPVIELHISNIAARPEEHLHHSRMSAIATAVIMGAGTNGYVLALRAAARLIKGTGDSQ
jgi:3-dehydroquinate dehydratase II